MFVVSITEKRQKNHNGLCSNLRCMAPMEPPFSVLDFEMEGIPKRFKRMFCVDCMKKLTHMPQEEIEFEVLENETH